MSDFVGGGPRSRALFERACRALPGGVNSPVRAFGSVGGTPVVFERGAGAHLFDMDGWRYLDLVQSWGALIAGHAHPHVVERVTEALAHGTSFGAPCPDEVVLAERVQDALPSVELVRMVSSGTEAVMSALRLARAHTDRAGIVKFRGCYHGHADAMLVRAGSGVATLGLPDSPGVPEGAARDTLLADFNELDSVAELFVERGSEIAAVVVEPVAGNMGFVAPEPGFLEGLRALTEGNGALLIFDEVMTGFRVGPQGAQGRFGVRPDLTTLGKVIGGGLPVGAFGGRADVMEALAPAGPVYQAGTLSGNPLAMRAGLATLEVLDDEGVWERLEGTARAFTAALEEAARGAGVPLVTAAAGAMFGFAFTGGAVRGWDTAAATDQGRFRSFFHAMLERGVYLPPSPFEACFVATPHGQAEVEAFAEAALGAMEVAAG